MSFKLSETVVPPGVAVTMLHGTGTVPGSLAMSGDGLNGTFVPAGPLAPNSIYTVLFTGLQDAAGNDQPAFSCFTTSGATTVTIDTTTGFFRNTTTPAASLVPPDLREARWALSSGALNGVVRFAAVESFFQADTNNVALYVDLDIDQNPNTGFKGFRDGALSQVDASFQSGLGVDYVIVMEPIDSAGRPNVYAARYVGIGQPDLTTAVTFLPDVCGHYFGFSVPLSALGNDDGKMDYSVLSESVASDGSAYADALPKNGKASFGAPAIAAASPPKRPTIVHSTPIGRATLPFRATHTATAPTAARIPLQARHWIRAGSR